MKSTSGNNEEELKKAERIAYLIAGHLKNTLTPQESDELDEWISASDENLELFEKLTDEDAIEAGIHQYVQIEKQKANVLNRIEDSIKQEQKPGKKIWPYLVAASIIIIAASLYLITLNGTKKTDEEPITQTSQQDINPGTDKAVLILADGRTVILDGKTDGVLDNNDGVKVTKQHGGELSYQKSSDAKQLTFHTLSIPRGGRYQLSLPDGSRVWLNAESSLHYPTNFTGQARNVDLKGEAYFEIAKDESKPFTVKILSAAMEQGKVTVLGTHFNINGYADEGVVTTSLLEGRVRVESREPGAGKVAELRPGEEAQTNDSGEVKVKKADVQEAIAWKEGKFLFRNATVKTIGEQIKRWYDVDVAYEGKITQHFNIEMSRQLPLSKLLDGLEGTMQVHFTLEGKKLTIKP